MLRISAPLVFLASPAFAHPGHLEVLAGHDHWVAGAAIGLAIAVGIWGALKGKKDPETEEDSTDEDTPEEEAAA